MGSNGFQTQKKKLWVSGQVRAERILADSTTNEGRKEWTCKFFSETNVDEVALWEQHLFGTAE